MKRIVTAGAVAVLAMMLTACSSSGKPSANPTLASKPPLLGGPASQPASAPATTPAPGSSGSQSTTINPCDLVTQDEASQLTHVSYGPGELETDSNASRRCVYGSQTHNVFEVILAQAATVEEAKAVKDDLLAQARQSDIPLPLKHVSGVGDDAQAVKENVSAGGVNICVSAIYVLSGTVGFALVDETNNAGGCPSTAALTDQAQTVISRLP